VLSQSHLVRLYIYIVSTGISRIKIYDLWANFNKIARIRFIARHSLVRAKGEVFVLLLLFLPIQVLLLQLISMTSQILPLQM